jgi:hypothetical protein
MTNNIDEIIKCIGTKDYQVIIEEKIKFLREMFVPVIIVQSSAIILEENIFEAGKIQWIKPTIDRPLKTPLKIMVDGINLSGIKFLAVFLHECGHVKDYDNPDIELKTIASEKSAWIHASKDFLSCNPQKADKEIFYFKMKKSLESYDITINRIEDILIL